MSDPLCSEGMNGARGLLKVLYVSLDGGTLQVALSASDVQIEFTAPYPLCLTRRKNCSIMIHEAFTTQKIRPSVELAEKPQEGV